MTTTGATTPRALRFPALRPGARIAVVAPAGALAADAPDPEVGCESVRALGFEPVPAPHLRSRHRYTAGRSDERAGDLRWALTAPDLDAVWFVRGGYGTVELLRGLPWERFDGRPVLGFSDATALLAALWARGRRAVHGPMVQRLPLLDETSRSALAALLRQGEQAPLPGHLIHAPAADGQDVAPVVGPVIGPVVGGNLTVLASLAGTPWALRAAGCILVLEDTGERPYRLDRSLAQLRESGALDGVRAIALGTFDRCGAEPAELESLFAELLAPLGVPVLGGLPVGHEGVNLAWVHGAVGRLDEHGIHFAVE